ncbi:MAG: purine-nucleoside phosphorylase [bacterium]
MPFLESPLPLIEAEALAQACAYVRSKSPDVPHLAVILGSGLGAFAERVQDGIVIPTEEIPHFPRSTVAGHAGRWIIGSIAGKRILAMQGRVHMYEGYPPTTVVFPVHTMAALGVERMIVTNAAGGINPLFAPGDLMLIDDHINMMFANPLRGQHRKDWGDRWPDMIAPYAPEFQKIALQTAVELGIPLRRGILFAARGPSYETAAEIQMARHFGAHAVTMSTVPEVIVAVSRRMQVIGISCITNLATGMSAGKLDHQEVTETANRIGATFTQLLTGVIKRIA